MNRTIKLAVALAAAMLLLGGCGAATVTETRVKTVSVAVRGPCPDDDTYAKIKAARPVPLREQLRPETEAAIRAAERGQLAAYEAPDGFADQAMAVIDDCHGRQEVTIDGE